MFNRSLHFKILFLVIGLVAAGVGICIYLGVKTRERDFLDEKLRAAKFVAEPVLRAIYEDMTEERADLVRYLLNDLGKAGGVGSLFIVRSNGVEEAFRDMKTIREVSKVYGKIRPEWVAGHSNEARNVAIGISAPEFRDALKAFRADSGAEPVHFIDTYENEPFFVYLQPIETRYRCKTCHAGDEARGILVIRMPLSKMYGTLERGTRNWIFAGMLGVAAGAVLLSIIIRRSITGPISRKVELIKKMADGKSWFGDRLETGTNDELGYLAEAFNDLLNTVQKREEENKMLLETVTNRSDELAAVCDAIGDMISIQDKNMKVLKVNRALALKLDTTPEALIGKPCYEVFYGRRTPCVICPFDRVITLGEVTVDETDDMVFDGTYQVSAFPVTNDKGEVWALVHVVRDLTREKLLRGQLYHAEKLSCVGKLVAGIAHELNNPLMGIMGFSQLLMDMQGDRPLSEAKDKLRRVSSETLRMAKIVQNLLTFARSKRFDRVYLSVSDIIRQTVDLRASSLRANNVEVSLDLAPDIPMTMADPYQMQQVFINVMNNAEDAITAVNRPGRLDIRAQGSRGKIKISFKDDGPGIPKTIIHKVFDPFFSTKETGKGTGLGLSIAHGIIAEHGGLIHIHSPEEGGVVVEIEIPVVGQEEWREVKKAIDSAAAEGVVLADVPVLVVDNDVVARSSLQDILIREGFKADVASDSASALDALGRVRYSLLIMDIKLAGLDGIGLYVTIAARYGYLKNRIILVTGDASSAEAREFIEKTGCPHILKPYEANELLKLIKMVLSMQCET